MTKADAIYYLTWLRCEAIDDADSHRCEALDMAIEALEAMGNTQNMARHVGGVEEGLISRQDVLGYIDRLDTTGLGKGKALEYIRKYVKKSQSVDLVRCRECKYCYYADNRVSDERGYVCDYYHFETEPNGYCHVGIRRKNDD